MEELIPIINRLQDVFLNVGILDNTSIDLPQIAVVGSQSSGKSSVLENIVGRDFLPRGSGIVTRRPLVLQLINIPSKYKDKKAEDISEKNKQEEEWGEFLHTGDKKFFDFAEIKQEIVRETDRVTGSNKGISNSPIHLKVFSPYVLNLTLVDLPGITKVPVGDQPKDIELQIRRMILQYISKPNCLILAVTAANTDLANSDALKLAKEVDKNGTRTLGVLTKLDIMDQGTDCMDIIRGEVIPLRLGFIGIVNRSQNDINTNKSIRDALKDEDRYFQNHPAYKSIADKMGTKYLARTLNRILLSHIREVLPDLKSKISNLMLQAQQRLNEYGVPLSESSMSNGALLLQLLTDFSTDYVDTIDGRNTDLSTNELYGGARINHIFTGKFYPSLNEVDACENLSEYDIKTAIRNAKGPRTSLFIPEAAFEMLVKRQVKLLEEPCITCVDRVLEELITIEENCEKILLRFPNLRDKTREFVVTLLKEYCSPLKDFIRNLIKIELAYINTNHPDFFGGGKNAMLLMNRIGKSSSQQDLHHPQQQQYNQQQLNQQRMNPNMQQQGMQNNPNMQHVRSLPNAYEDDQQQQQHQEDGDMQQQQGEMETGVNNDVEGESVEGGDWENIYTYGEKAKKKTEHVARNFFSNFFGKHEEQQPKKQQVVKNPTQQQQATNVRSTNNNATIQKNTVPPQNQQAKGRIPPPLPTSSTGMKQQQPNQTLQQPPQKQSPPQQQQQPQMQQYFEDYTSFDTQEKDPYFGTNSGNGQINPLEEREKMETEIIKTLLTQYFNIVRKNISDSVPKAVMHFLVNKSKINMQSELVRNLYKTELFDELLKENEAVAQKRKATQKMLKVLQRANDIITDVKTAKI